MAKWFFTTLPTWASLSIYLICSVLCLKLQQSRFQKNLIEGNLRGETGSCSCINSGNSAVIKDLILGPWKLSIELNKANRLLKGKLCLTKLTGVFFEDVTGTVNKGEPGNVVYWDVQSFWKKSHLKDYSANLKQVTFGRVYWHGMKICWQTGIRVHESKSPS